MTDTNILAGLELARKHLRYDRGSFVRARDIPPGSGLLEASDQEAADEYTAAIAAITGAAEELQRLTMQRDALMDGLRDEIVENLRLRDLGGARPDEGITAMTERVIRECDALKADLARSNTLFRAWQAHAQVLQAAVDAAADFAATVAGGSSWWEDVWATHVAAIDQTERLVSEAGRSGHRVHDPSGAEPARPCRTCGPEGCPDSTSCPREGGAA